MKQALSSATLPGGHNYLLTGNIVAGNPRVVKAMLANMREHLSEALKR
ncbi:inositol-1-monophosphatase [Klebsiella michiganensis]|uniref:Inositol-1-monophosphatase n=1 Tax=Klebsiella michiganensis TaxID=1134687 RepID=A0A7H4PNA6_9ENTR|nr:inositol-1-monophosphatase [Klebsiella michiganensis]